MGVEVLDSSMEINDLIMDESMMGIEDDKDGQSAIVNQIDARRRLENKLEEMRLLREVQEFDFDIDFDS